ncbi:hypothetical protein F2Q69_00013423 [Brassica cretica]|uniref:Aspartic peptidase DDI1-type domain-containing protein n=2 Tax=Brassica cretica TaxID=69181 RepID=A0A8S9RA17_BRACR|nr:hypothetical protein F2Q69_00013423 [Brassica cretica]
MTPIVTKQESVRSDHIRGSYENGMKAACLVQLGKLVSWMALVGQTRQIGELDGFGRSNLPNGLVRGREAGRRRFQSRKFDEFRRITLVSIDARYRKLIDERQSKPIDSFSRTSINDTYGVDRILQCRKDYDSRGVRSKTPTSAQPCLCQNRSMPKIDVTRLNALRPQPKPSANPPETTSTHSDDAAEPIEVDKAPMGRTLRKRNGKVPLEGEANEKEMESFQKRVFRIPFEKPFEETYFTNRLWMFFRETRETEEDIRRMFCEAKEKMKSRITLKKKSDPEKFAVPCTVKGIEFPHALCDTGVSVSVLPRVMTDHLDLEVHIGNALVPVDFHDLDIKLNWNSSMFLGRAFLSTVGAVCNVHTNQLCLTLKDPRFYYYPIPVMKPHASSRRIDDPGLIAACHCKAEYETEYSALIETHTAASIDSANQKSIDIPKEESINSSPSDWENDYYNPTMAAHTTDTMHTKEYDEDYEEERAIEYKAILDEEDRLLHHSSWKRNKYRQHTRPSIDIDAPSSIDRRPEFGKRAYDRDGTRRFHWEEKDEYGVYRDDQGHARDVDGHIIRVSMDDIRSLLERASMDEYIYLCLLEHASSFTQTKVVPEIYTKDDINDMFYGVCGAQEKNEGDFQMKLDGVYYPLNDSISWLTTCIEEMTQDIAKIQTHRATEEIAPASIDRHQSTLIDDNPPHSNPMKSQPDSYTKAEIDQLVEEIYRTLESAEERLDRRGDDIYFPMDLAMSSLTSQIEAIQREIVKFQRYIARRP